MKKRGSVCALPASLPVCPRHGEGGKGKFPAPERRKASGMPYDFDQGHRFPEGNLYPDPGNRRAAETQRETAYGVGSLSRRYRHSPYLYREHGSPVDVCYRVKEPPAAFGRRRGASCGACEQGEEKKCRKEFFSGHYSYNVIQNGKQGKENPIGGFSGCFACWPPGIPRILVSGRISSCSY